MMISFCIIDVDVNHPQYKEDKKFGINPGNGVVNLFGDAPIWKYCALCSKAIIEGTAIVTVKCGSGVSQDPYRYIIVHSTLPEYTVGKTLDECEVEFLFDGDPDKFKSVRGQSPVLSGQVNCENYSA